MEKHTPTQNKIFEKTAVLFLCVVAGLRYSTGRDYFSYLYYYELFQDNYDMKKFEVGFDYLIKFANELGLSYNAFLAIQSIFIILVTYNALIKNIPIKYRYVSFFFFVIIKENFFDIAASSLLRQAIAVAFFIIATRYIISKNLKAYIITIAIGSLFHESILVLLPLYFINKISIKIIYAALLALLIFLFAPEILSNALYETLKFANLNSISSESYFLIENRGLTFRQLLKNSFLLIVLVQLVLFAALLKKTDDNAEQVYIKLLLLGFLFRIYTATGLDMFYRMIFYFYPFYIPVIYIFLREHKSIKNGQVMFAFLMIFAVFNVKSILQEPEYSKYSQYQYVLFKDKNDIANDRIAYKQEADEITQNILSALKDKN
ncbi:MAG: EpsG family protein [Helicobacteraceae bacterium]